MTMMARSVYVCDSTGTCVSNCVGSCDGKESRRRRLRRVLRRLRRGDICDDGTCVSAARQVADPPAASSMAKTPSSSRTTRATSGAPTGTPWPPARRSLASRAATPSSRPSATTAATAANASPRAALRLQDPNHDTLKCDDGNATTLNDTCSDGVCRAARRAARARPVVTMAAAVHVAPGRMASSRWLELLHPRTSSCSGKTCGDDGCVAHVAPARVASSVMAQLLHPLHS